jgi:hypothetical protein
LDPGIFCSKNLELQHMSWLNIHCTGVYWHEFRTLFLNSSWKQSIIGSHMEQTVQVIVGMPFLAAYPTEYLSRAFNLGRVFIHFWYIHLSLAHFFTTLCTHFGLPHPTIAHLSWC